MKRFSLKVFARFWHRKLMWLVGLQLFIWAATGLYMVSIDIHTIHGEHVLSPPPAIDLQQVKISPNEMVKILNRTSQSTTIKQISLQQLPTLSAPASSFISKITSEPVYVVTYIHKQTPRQLYSATTGLRIKPFTDSQIIAFTKAQLHPSFHDLAIKQVQYLTQLPSEVSPRNAPALQITLATWDNLTLYVDPQSAKIVTIRHDLWRIFDWAWRLHITDYDDGENIHNWWLQLLASMSILSIIMGSITLAYRIKTRPTQHHRAFKRHIFHKWLACIMLLPLSIWLCSGIALSVLHKEPITTLHDSKQIPNSLVEDDINIDITQLSGNTQQAPLAINLVFRLNQWIIEVIDQQGLHANLRSHQRLFRRDGQAFVMSDKNIKTFIEDTAPSLGKITEIRTFTPNWFTLTGYQNPILRVTFTEHSQQHYFDLSRAKWIGADTPKNRLLQLMRTLHFMDYLALGGFNHIWNIFFASIMLILSISGISMLLRPK